MAPAASYELLVWLIRISGAAERGPSAEQASGEAACRARCILSRPQP